MTLRLPRKLRRLQRGCDGERGTAMVEMAIILPVFVFILFALIEFGRALNYWIDETHLANQAARWVIVNKNPTELGCSAGDTNCLATYLPSQADSGELKT